MSRPDVDPYEILGLERGASWDQIRTSYRRLAKKHHPDKNPGDPASEWIFKQVNQAYERLRDIDGVHDEEAPKPSRSSPVRRYDRQDREPQARARPEQSREQAPKGGHRRNEQHRKARPAAWQDPKEWGKTAAMLAAFFLFAYVSVPEARRCFFGCDAGVGGRDGTNSPSTDAPEAESIQDPSDLQEDWMRGFLEDYNRERLQAELGVPETAPAQPPKANTARPVSSTGNPALPPAATTRPLTEVAFFTRGSHEEDLLRIQGTPTKIQAYSALGYEDWYYDRNKVTISTTTRRVTEWSNSNGTLNVRLTSGANVTGSEFFSRGSHEDDVLRIQGTPTTIQRYTALGYEDWYYGRNTVTISTATRRVTEWSNSNGTLKVRMVPGANKDSRNEASATLVGGDRHRLRWWCPSGIHDQRNLRRALRRVVAHLCRDRFPSSTGEACVLMGESPESRVGSTLFARDSGRSVGLGPVDRLVGNRLQPSRLLARTCAGGSHCVGHRGADLGFQDGRASCRKIKSRKGMTEPDWEWKTVDRVARRAGQSSGRTAAPGRRGAAGESTSRVIARTLPRHA